VEDEVFGHLKALPLLLVETIKIRPPEEAVVIDQRRPTWNFERVLAAWSLPAQSN